MIPRLILGTIQALLDWYDFNLCCVELRDPRGYRVRFQVEGFIHLIQLKNKYGQEPRNARMAIDEIRAGKIKFVAGRFDSQRASELAWAVALATDPDSICGNWQALGTGEEVYVRNFGTQDEPKFRVMVCKVIGTTRQVVTIFPRERMGSREQLAEVWTKKDRADRCQSALPIPEPSGRA